MVGNPIIMYAHMSRTYGSYEAAFPLSPFTSLSCCHVATITHRCLAQLTLYFFKKKRARCSIASRSMPECPLRSHDS